MAFKPAEWPRKLRSQEWYGGNSRDTIYHRGWLKNQGYPHDLFEIEAAPFGLPLRNPLKQAAPEPGRAEIRTL